MPVNTPHPEHSKYTDKWRRCRDTFDGADAIKEAGEKYLPRATGMTSADYEAYKTRATFFNNVMMTVVALTGTVFLKPLRVIGAPDPVAELLDDVTMSGVTLGQFAKEMVGQVISPGRFGILVDMPRENGRRPYLVGYRAEDVFNWHTVQIGGEQIPTMVVLRERISATDDDEFEVGEITQFRVLRLERTETQIPVYTVEIWRQPDPQKDEWAPIEKVIPTRRGQPLTFIPFVPAGPEGTIWGISDPPLISLVDTNLSHYRTMADLEWAMHFTALPTPYITGVDDDSPVHIGSSKILKIPDAAGRADYMEFKGTGISALRQADSDKREMMAAVGARMLERAGAPATATEVRLRHAGETATLSAIVQSCGQALTHALQWFVWWMGTEDAPDRTVQVELNQEFMAIEISPEELKAAMTAWQAGAISYEQFFYRLQRGGFYAEGTTQEEELARIRSESEDRLRRAVESLGDGSEDEGMEGET